MKKFRKFLIFIFVPMFLLSTMLKPLKAQNLSDFNIVPLGNGAWTTGTIDPGTGLFLNNEIYVLSSNFMTVYPYTYSFENYVDYDVYVFCYSEPKMSMSFYLGMRILRYENIYGTVTFPQGTKYILVSYEDDPNGPILIYPSGLIENIESESYQHGFEDGEWLGYQNGSFDTYETAKNEGFNLGYDNGYNIGYNEGLNSNVSGDITLLTVLQSAFSSFDVILGVEIFPNITLGTFVGVPLVFGVAMFILGRKVEK